LQEVSRNLSTLVRAAVRIHTERSDVRFLVACFNSSHQQKVQEYLRARGLSYIESHVGRTPEIIELAHSCIAVSGSVGLELLYRGRPAVVVYRVRRFDLFVCRLFKTSDYISLVNLLAGKELYPEFLTDRCAAETISRHILHWLNDRAAYDAVRAGLRSLRAQVAQPGASERAARFILEVIHAGHERPGRNAA
jgi:lipid-A-disaccharide synthase